MGHRTGISRGWPSCWQSRRQSFNHVVDHSWCSPGPSGRVYGMYPDIRLLFTNIIIDMLIAQTAKVRHKTVLPRRYPHTSTVSFRTSTTAGVAAPRRAGAVKLCRVLRGIRAALISGLSGSEYEAHFRWRRHQQQGINPCRR